VSAATQAIARWKGLFSKRQSNIILNLLPWLMTIVLGGVAVLFSDKFLTVANLSNIMEHAAPLAIMVVGEIICLMVGFFDMAIESTLVLSAVFGAWLIADHPLASGLQLSPYLGMMATLAFGALIGLVQGFLIVKIEANALMTTLALSVVLRGVALAWLEGSSIFPLPNRYRLLGVGHIGFIRTSIFLVFCVYVVFHLFLTRLPLGRSIFAVGGNETAAKASGIKVDRVKIVAFVISGLMAALAGLVLSGRTNTASVSLASGRIWDVFAAAVIGGVSLQGGKGNVVTAFGGVLLLTVIGNILHIFPFASHLLEAVRGGTILVAALVDAARWRRKLAGGT
jgi:simple sugar transport system permease protein